jgi:hypothetical protein
MDAFQSLAARGLTTFAKPLPSERLHLFMATRIVTEWLKLDSLDEILLSHSGHDNEDDSGIP